MFSPSNVKIELCSISGLCKWDDTYMTLSRVPIVGERLIHHESGLTLIIESVTHIAVSHNDCDALVLCSSAVKYEKA